MSRLVLLAALLVAVSAPRAQEVPDREASGGRLAAVASPGGLAVVGLAGLPSEAPPVEAEGLAVVPSEAPAPVMSEAVENAPMFYAAERAVELRSGPGTGGRIATLGLRDTARLLDGGDREWALVWTESGRGYVRRAELSNLWILVDKSERTTYVYQGADLLHELPADVSASEGDKIRRSTLNDQTHWRIPEGVFFVSGKNPNSQYYKAFVISYPNPEHGLRGLRDGLISQREYEQILASDRDSRRPPMGTALGGMIEIHGQGTGRQRAWTRGCVALRNVHMDDLWDLVQVGTPVVIEE